VRSGDELLFNRSLGANLRRQRLAAGLTQDLLAGQAGMSRASIANIERGDQMPGLYRLLLLCAALRCELDDVLPSTAIFSLQSVAETMSDEYASAVMRLRKQAQAQRESERPA